MMRAARLIEAGKPLEVREIPKPEPAEGEVIVQVHACGLCGTELKLAVEGDLPVSRKPITLGHEAAGIVARIGAGVKSAKEGDRVALFPAASCGACRFCRVGRESLCDRSEVYGMTRDGSLAEFVAAPVRSVIPLPDDVDFDIGAVVTDGVATPFHALRSRGRLVAGEKVAIIGCGGLGTHAIQLARMMGAGFIVAIDTQTAALSRAQQLGADLCIDPIREDARKVVRAIGGVDLALEFVGTAKTVQLAMKCLAKSGRTVVVGVGPERATLPPLAAFVGREQSIVGSFGMDRADIEDLYALLAAGRLDLSGSVSARFPLDRANDALQHLARKESGVVRVLVKPQAEQ